MNKEQLLTVFSDILSKENVLRPRGFDEENYYPHQFRVGAKHQVAAEERNDGVMTEEILQEFPCEHLYCDVAYEDHTSKKTLIMQLTRDATVQEVNVELIKIKAAMKEHDVVQCAFADTEEKFTFINNGPTEDEGKPQE
jgi:hypothetical protein